MSQRQAVREVMLEEFRYLINNMQNWPEDFFECEQGQSQLPYEELVELVQYAIKDLNANGTVE